MKLPCKSWPLAHAHPAFPKELTDWGWIIKVKLSHKHSPQTKWFEAWVDSGSPWCLFHADICPALGIRLESGVQSDLKGIVGGAKVPMYYHKIQVTERIPNFPDLFKWIRQQIPAKKTAAGRIRFK